jgi:hypothetical protein
MTDASTGAMQQFRVGAPDDSAGPEAGLVLLYAEAFAALPPVFPLVKTSILVGRDEAADVRLPVSAVSRRHAELQWERGRWSLRDLGSRNGTLVDGHLVEEVELDDCAEIRIGDSILKLVEKDAASFAPFRIDGVRLQGPRALARVWSGDCRCTGSPSNWRASLPPRSACSCSVRAAPEKRWRPASCTS